MLSFFFFFNDTATTEIYTLSLHDALPILFSTSFGTSSCFFWATAGETAASAAATSAIPIPYLKVTWPRSEEHTSELQSQSNLVCRLLLEKKKNKHKRQFPPPRS